RGLQERLRDRLGAPSALPAEGAEVEGVVEERGSGARTVPRRRLLEGAGIAASALVVGGIAEHLIEGRPALQEGAQEPMVPHQGWVLRASQASARLDCPCHRAAFSLDGTVLFHEFADPLRPLPTLMVRRDGSDVQVFLPPPETV